MSELNAEQIKKALECCQIRHIEKNCDECYYHRWLEPTCRGVLCEDALSLINELTEENERLEDNLLKQCAENIMLLMDQIAKEILEENNEKDTNTI